MQASKVMPGRTYAVKRNDKLLRFIASEVVTTTRRKGDKANPHDYDSTIEGYWVDSPTGSKLVHEGVEQRKRATLKPDDLLGEFDAYEELVARKAAEDEAREAKADREKQDAIDLAKALYELSGIVAPEEGGRLRQGEFRVNYGDVSIKREGVVALLLALKKEEAA